jgi:hypothetical protein
VYDDYERRSGLVRVRDAHGEVLGDFASGEWSVESVGGSRSVLARSAARLHLRKTIALDGDRMTGSLGVAVEVAADAAFVGTLELEWNLNLLGGGGNREAFYRWADQEIRHDSPGSVAAGADLSFGNRYEGVAITVALQPAAPQEWFPVETVSNSEAGFERVYQGSCLAQRWSLNLAAGESATFATSLYFTQSRDHSAEQST